MHIYVEGETMVRNEVHLRELDEMMKIEGAKSQVAEGLIQVQPRAERNSRK